MEAEHAAAVRELVSRQRAALNALSARAAAAEAAAADGASRAAAAEAARSALHERLRRAEAQIAQGNASGGGSGFTEWVQLSRSVGALASAGREWFATPNDTKSQDAFFNSLAKVEAIAARRGAHRRRRGARRRPRRRTRRAAPSEQHAVAARPAHEARGRRARGSGTAPPAGSLKARAASFGAKYGGGARQPRGARGLLRPALPAIKSSRAT